MTYPSIFIFLSLNVDALPAWPYWTQIYGVWLNLGMSGQRYFQRYLL